MNIARWFRRPKIDPALARAALNLSEAIKESAKSKPYRFDNSWNFSFPHNPRRPPRSILSIDQLKSFADNCDVLRSCILHLAREVWATKVVFSPRDPSMDKGRAASMLAEAEAFFADFGGLGGENRWRMHFEFELVDSLCVTGAAAVYMSRSRGGRLVGAECIESATIRPVVDAYGYATDFPYEQWEKGVPVRRFRPDELLYVGLWSQTNSPYFKSPIEWILAPLIMALKSDEWNRSLLADGETLRDVLSVPAEWSVDQIGAYLEMMTMVRKQNPRAPLIMPGGSARLGARTTMDKEFADLDMWILRRICSIFGVQPASIGYVGEQYKVSQEGSMAATTQFGAAALIEFRNSVFNWLLAELGLGELECKTRIDEPTESPGEKAARLVKLTGRPVMTVNEARAQIGLEPLEGGDSLDAQVAPAAETQAPQPGAETEPEPDGGQDGEPERVERAGITIDWRPTPERRKKAESMFAAAKDLFNKKGLDIIAQFVQASFDDGVGEALDQFASAYAQAVTVAHIQAAQAGGTITALPRKRAVEIGKTEGAEQKGFVDAMRDKFKVELMLPDADVEAVAERIKTVHHPLYVGGLTGTANKAAVEAIPDGTPIHWKLDPTVENHCRDCPSLEAMGPYTPETLPCHPGDGFTECLTRCRCGLYLDDGTFVSIDDWSDDGGDGGDDDEDRADALRKWEKKALNRLRAGRPADCGFETGALGADEIARIRCGLRSAESAEAVRAVFDGV